MSAVRLNAATAIVAALALAAIAVVLYDASETSASYFSAYDGTDPFHEQCSSDALGRGTAVLNYPLTRVRDATGVVIARLELEYSSYCDTAWPRVVLIPAARARFKGRFLRLAATRKAQDVVAPYQLPLSGGGYGWGNMVSIEDSCVFVTATLLPASGKQGGSTATTPCLNGSKAR